MREKFWARSRKPKKKSKTLFDMMLEKAPEAPGPGVYMKALHDPFSDSSRFEPELIIICPVTEKVWCVSIEDGEIFEITEMQGHAPLDVARYDAAALVPLDIEAFRAAWASKETS